MRFHPQEFIRKTTIRKRMGLAKPGEPFIDHFAEPLACSAPDVMPPSETYEPSFAYPPIPDNYDQGQRPGEFDDDAVPFLAQTVHAESEPFWVESSINSQPAADPDVDHAINEARVALYATGQVEQVPPFVLGGDESGQESLSGTSSETAQPDDADGNSLFAGGGIGDLVNAEELELLEQESLEQMAQEEALQPAVPPGTPGGW